MCDVQGYSRNSGGRTDGICKTTSSITLSNNLFVVLTTVVTFNSGLHQRFHPFPDDGLSLRIKHVSLVIRMLHLEAIASGLDSLVGGDLVTRSVDISLDLSLLK